MDWRSLARKYGWQGLLVLVGSGLVSQGAWSNWEANILDTGVEIVEGGEGDGGGETDKGQMVVDVEGAVMKPGVYRLKTGSRLGEVIETAGGMTVEADTGWVAKNMNLAETMKDGSKVYIPSREANVQVLGEQSSVKIAGSININRATATELDQLWGIGAARAQAIIDNRPYQNIQELISKASIPAEVVERNRDKLAVY